MRRYYNGNPENPEDGTWNDRWIVEEIFEGKRNGYFIEAGACNGIAGSSTYVLEKEFGWTGILVEAVAEYFEHLGKNRPNSICVNACLYGTVKKVEFLQFNKNKGCSSIEKHKHASHEERMAHEEYAILIKDTVTLKQLLEQANAPKIIDYLGLDLNGSEYNVLAKFPFNEYIFKAISIEGAQCNKLLKANGYVQVWNPFTDATYEHYFIHKSCIDINYHI